MRTLMQRRQLWYAPMSLVASGLLFAKNLLYAGLLAVEDFGDFNKIALLTATLVQFAGLGFQLLCQKDLPRLHAGVQATATRALLTQSVAVMIAGLTVAIMGLLIVVWYDPGASMVLWSLAVLCSLVQYAFLLGLTDMRSDLRFIEHATLSLLRGLSLILCGGLCAWLTSDVRAVVLAEAVATGVLAAWVLRGRLEWGALRTPGWFRDLAPRAARLLLLNGTVLVLFTLDRWTGMLVLDDRQFGMLALGLMMLTVFETLQTVVSVATFPLMARHIAAGDRSAAYRIASRATLIVLGATLVGCVPLVLVLEWAIARYLPEYLGARVVLQFAVLAGALRLANFYNGFAILNDREQRLAGLLGGYLVLLAAAVATVSGALDVRFTPETIGIITVLASLGNLIIGHHVARGAMRTVAA